MNSVDANRKVSAPSSKPPRGWALALLVMTGVAAGVGAYTFRYAEGLSYFSTDPAACVNCHIMRPQYDSWLKSSHHGVAVCIDCHLPHDFIGKYIAKAENGYRHSKEFTAQTFAEPIVIQSAGREILQQNCIQCHAPLVADNAASPLEHGQSLRCTHCHLGVGHGERSGLGGPLDYARNAHAPAAPATPAHSPKQDSP